MKILNPYNIFERLRLILVIIGAFLSYHFYAAQPQQLLHSLMPWVVLPIAGLTGIQGLFFGKNAALAHERQTGTLYQKQSAANNLALAITALIVWLGNWGMHADAAVLTVLLIFLVISATIHTWEAIKLKHAMRKHLMRPIWTLALLALCLPPLLQILF